MKHRDRRHSGKAQEIVVIVGCPFHAPTHLGVTSESLQRRPGFESSGLGDCEVAVQETGL